MNFDRVAQLLKSNTTVKLITAGNAALIISFLFRVFKESQSRFKADVIPEKELISLLADTLYVLNQDVVLFPKEGREYLTDWANSGFLRKFPGKDDEYLYELTPSTENVFKWMDSLDKREFIGTESRLKNLFERLQELAGKTREDATVRIAELRAKQKMLKQEIADIEAGKMDMLDDWQIKEQYFLIEDTAKSLLADFRQVEQNFRDIDRNFRRKIITTSQMKGEVLAELFVQQDFLTETDQGKSFMAFWEFLLSQSKQKEFDRLVEEVLDIPLIQQLQKENFSIDTIKNNLIDVGDKANKTTNSLLDQLRKYLEHKSFFENKRIYDNITEVLKMIGENPEADFAPLSLLELDEIVHIDLITDRPLFAAPEKIKFTNSHLQEGKAVGDDALLFEQFAIDMGVLRDNVRKALKNRLQISFVDFVQECGIEKGVAEVVAYLEIASKENNHHVVSEELFDLIDIHNSKTGKYFKVKVPQIIFCK